MSENKEEISPNPDALLEEYKHTTSNAQDVTRQVLSIVNCYLVMIGLFATAISIIITNKPSIHVLYLTITLLLVVLVSISENFKLIVFKLRYAFIDWCQKSMRIRNYLLKDFMIPELQGLCQYNKPKINLENSMFTIIIRIIGILNTMAVAIIYYCVIMLINTGMYNNAMKYQWAIFTVSILTLFTYFLERRYDYDSLHEIATIMENDNEFPAYKNSLCMAAFPFTIIIYGTLLDSSKITLKIANAVGWINYLSVLALAYTLYYIMILYEYHNCELGSIVTLILCILPLIPFIKYNYIKKKLEQQAKAYGIALIRHKLIIGSRYDQIESYISSRTENLMNTYSMK
jgi:hypothetical protein